ncbi:DUF927 domain-containing protein [Methylobacterium mesophilicum]
MLSLDGIARALGGEVRGNMVRAPGPDHSPADRSLGVWITDTGDDITVDSKAGDDPIHCKDYARSRIGLRAFEPKAASAKARDRRPADSVKVQGKAASKKAAEAETIVLPVPAEQQPPRFFHPKSGGAAAVYTYRDGEGHILGHVARFTLIDGKTFLPFTLWQVGDELHWRNKSWPKLRPLYGLDRLAERPNASVIVCEGEKAADAAQRIFPNSVVVTSPGGSNSAKAADWSPLTVRQVMIWPDNDVPGLSYATDVERELAGVGAGIVTIVDAMRVAGVRPNGEERESIEGWDAADGLNEGWQLEALAALVSKYAERVEPSPSYVSFDHFRMSSEGLTAEVIKGRGESATTETIWICAAFEVIGRARDPNGFGWARWLRWLDPDGRRHEHAVSDAALHGDMGALAADLASRGLVISRAGRGPLCDYLNRLRVRTRVTTVNRTGWHLVGEHRVFVLPDAVIGQPEAERVVLTGATAAPYSRKGTLQEWRDGVGRLTAGHGRLVLALSTAFAGPLVDLVGGEGGGVNLYGQSSRGKTTGLKAAASVWGRGASDPGFVRSWRATANAQEATAAIVTDTLLCLDEIGVAEGRDAAAAVYQLASGVGKGRSARDGSIRAPMTWRVLTLSTGELPMAAKIAEDKQRKAYAGQAVRLLDVPADAGRGFGLFDNAGPDGDPARLAEALQKAAVIAYGEAGPAFVRALMDMGLEQARALVVDLVDGFVAEHAPPDADGQVRRAAARLGMIAAAGELARTFNIVPWEEGEADAAAARALADWINSRGGTEPAEVREAITQVRRFFEAHGDSRFETADDPDARPVTNRAGWRRGHGDGRVWLVLPEMWKSEVCSGLDPVATARILAEHGMLKRDKAKLQRPERTPAGQLRVYVITAAVFDGGSDAI